uniref:Sialic acid binding lectin n=1 Tax=Helix pomatia TaxID=6536 RepID=Q1KM18_HELPO|nr:sialic acid binding lectin [Helix pomatia]
MLFVTIISLGLLAIVHGQCALKTIAFSAAIDREQTFDANQVVIYDIVITNHGNAYDNSTGLFTAPVDGMYSFQLNLLTIKEKEGWLELVHNGQLKVSVYAKQDSTYDSSSNSVIIKMKEGDRVNVRAHKKSGLFGRDDELYNTFSGHFLSGL